MTCDGKYTCNCYCLVNTKIFFVPTNKNVNVTGSAYTELFYPEHINIYENL